MSNPMPTIKICRWSACVIIEHLDYDFISWSCVKSMSALELIAEMNTLMPLVISHTSCAIVNEGICSC